MREWKDGKTHGHLIASVEGRRNSQTRFLPRYLKPFVALFMESCMVTWPKNCAIRRTKTIFGYLWRSFRHAYLPIERNPPGLRETLRLLMNFWFAAQLRTPVERVAAECLSISSDKRTTKLSCHVSEFVTSINESSPLKPFYRIFSFSFI